MTLSASSDSCLERVYAALTSRHAEFSLDDLSPICSTHEDLQTALQELVREGRAAALPNERYLSDIAANRLRETARRLAAAYHKQNPLRRAMPPEGLAASLQKAAVFQDFDRVVSWLISEEILVSEGELGFRLPGHQVQMPIAWQKAAEEIRAVYASAGLQPPMPGNFQANYPRDVSVNGILAILVESGELVTVGDRLYVSAAAIEETKTALRRLAESPEGITVGGLRNATGASRRIILPLLEYFDAQGITQRSGESRVLA
ncbi:MAG: SelB C-terminal domain-containing protein [Armatimonadota bacterium]